MRNTAASIGQEMTFHPVTRRMSNPRYDCPDVIESVVCAEISLGYVVSVGR
jgi:hypothetical protein